MLFRSLELVSLEAWDGDRLETEEVPLRNAMNEVLRDEYVSDNEKGIEYFNKVCAKHDNPFRFQLPHRRFNRRIGIYSEAFFDVDGNPLDEATWNARATEWLPSDEERSYVHSLMKPCTEPGKIASWIAPPAKGIDGHPFAFEYVRL